MSTRMTNLLRAALENSCEQPVVIEDPVEFQQLADAERQQAELEKADSKEELDQVAAGLEAIANALEDNRDTGLSLEAAHYLNLAVKSHTARIGVTQSVIASMESFQGGRARVATSISLEGIREVQKTVQAMKEVI